MDDKEKSLLRKADDLWDEFINEILYKMTLLQFDRHQEFLNNKKWRDSKWENEEHLIKHLRSK